ncbi:hypothetical protein GBA52_008238 [Prunus armeniaca]|nr:hypothetical protein GBA52_008238 [Prunus armeniaca]
MKKFKEFLTENGVDLLEMRFLPALDKMGKICHLYLNRDHVIFLHKLLNGDGVQSIAQFRKEALFDDYRISSQNEDCISFAVDVSLLHRALRSCVSICTEFLNVSISKYGDLHIQISTTLITLGAEFQTLLVLGERADAPSEDRNLSAQTRSARTILRGDAQSVEVSVKHFGKSLQCQLGKPNYAFYGIAPQGTGACWTVIFQFFIPGSHQMDKSISLHCRLPVRDQGSG